MDKQNEFNSFSVIHFAWKWRKILFIVTLLSGILAFAVSMFIKPMFQSTAIVYAPQYNSLLVDNYEVKNDLHSYGHEYEAEQLMQILNSREFKDTLVRQFNLIEHYEIDTLHKYWRSKLYKELEEKIKINRTQYLAVVISVLDKDPKFAATLANAMVDELDMFKNKMELERSQAACKLIRRQIDEVHERMVKVNDSVQKLANEGIFIYDVQVDRIMQQYTTALAQGNMSGAQRIQKEVVKLAKWGPTSVVLREHLIYLVRRETMLNSLLWNAEMNLAGLMPTKFVVEKAVPIEKKVYPKKSLIAIFSAIGAFIVTFFVLLAIEKIKTEIPTYKKEEE
jgi:LPS O-antigen subunit length determinant protein (WzzB/FepE family)